MVLDAIRLNRTDSALIRVSTPLSPDAKQSQQRLVVFARQVISNTLDLSPR